MSPLDFKNLLPEAGFHPEDPEVYPWVEICLREPDWCEVHFSGFPATPDSSDYSLDFYEDNKELLIYRQETLTQALLTDWYLERARTIDLTCGAVDNALELIKCGRERNVQGLEQLHCELLTLETMVYECQLSEPVSLKLLEETTNEEKIKLLMQGSTAENFVRHCRQCLLPFLERVERFGEKSFPLLLQYLVSVAADQINLCKLFLEASRPDNPEPLLPNMEQLIAVSLECIYTCQREDQLFSCCSILECLPERGSGEWNEVIEKYHEQADELEKHIMVCRILEEYGCPVTPSRVRSSQTNPVEVKKLFFSLANCAASKTPPLSDAQWQEVLSKMLDMQRTVFKCVDPEDCYEMLVSCLLCSGRKETILLASTMIQGSAKKSALLQHGDKSGGRLPYNRSLNLVLVAAEKYFNLAADLADPSITLARTCLNLMTDLPPAVQNELDLIHSLSLLQEFSLSLIPLQVRLCKDRLDIIKQALRSKPQAYTNIQQLLRLATFLRVCGEDKKEREGQVIILVAEAALEDGDYASSYQACQQLMERRYVQSWTVCRKLGTCGSFQDIKGRIQLLAFSVAYCTPELIEELMRIKDELELQELKQSVSVALSRAFPSKEESDKEDQDQDDEHLFVSGLRQTKEISLQVFQSTQVTTRRVLATVGSPFFWKDAIKWIQIPGPHQEIEWNGSSYSVSASNNRDMKKIGLPTFYLNTQIHHEVHISQISTCYNRYLLPDLPDDLKTRQDILHAALIEDSLKGTDNMDSSELDSQVLVELCKQTISEDVALALGFLYPLISPADADQVFSAFPRTAVILEIAAYYFCLCMLAHVKEFNPKITIPDETRDHMTFTENIYMRSPSQVIAMGEQLCSEKEDCKSQDNISSWTSLFLRYRKLLSQRTQADLLGSLHEMLGSEANGHNRFDIETFLADDSYKERVMLQLASSPNDVFVMVKSLAEQYHISLWEIFFIRIKHLITDSSISPDNLEREVTAHKMAETLGTSADQLRKRMCEEVIPFLEGSDLTRLAFAYSFLEKCGDLPDPETDVKPSQELRLIKKLIPNCPGINYLELMNPTKCELTILQVLTPNNVQIFVKNAARFPRMGGGAHTSSSIYRMYGQKLFFELNVKKQASSYMDWVHRYESCSDCAGKMLASDFLDFVNYVTFSEIAVRTVLQDSRVEINRRALKHSKHKEHTGENDGSKEWHFTSEALKGNLEHLRKLEDQLVVELRNSNAEYAIKFDMSRSVPENLENLVVEAVLDGLPMSCLQTLLALTPVELELDPAQAYSRAVQLLTQHLRCPEMCPHPFLEGKDLLSVLRNVLADVTEDGELMTEDHQVELLSPLLSDAAAPATYRMAVADLLEKDLDLSSESQDLVLFCRTQCLVSGDWPQVEMGEISTNTPEERQQLFDQLLVLSETRDQLEALAHLALTWPSSDTTEESWQKLFLRIIPLSSTPRYLDDVITIFQRVLQSTAFSTQSFDSLYEGISSINSIEHLIHFAVISDEKGLLDKVHLLLQMKEEPVPVSDRLLDLLREKHLVTWSAGTPIFGALSRRILVKSPEVIPQLVKELNDSGHKLEAGTLLMDHQRAHAVLSTFSGALGALKNWISQE